jgi:hypothetical protein
VLFLDAYDVLLLPSCTRANLLRRFTQARAPVLFGAEASSSPDLAAALVDREFPDTKLGRVPAYLNSGTIIGAAGTLLCVLAEVKADMVVSGHDVPADSNDQR